MRIKYACLRALREIQPHFELLAEALQTCMRAEGIADGSEQLKTLTRSRGSLTADEYREILHSLPLSRAKNDKLAALTPETYLGEAPAVLPSNCTL